MKQKYETPILNIQEFRCEDVVATVSTLGIYSEEMDMEAF